MKTTPVEPRHYPPPSRRLRILVVEEGGTMNCDLFRDAPEHDLHFLDCGPEGNSGKNFRSRWAEVRRAIERRGYDLAIVTDRKHCFWKPGAGAFTGFLRLGKAACLEPRRLAHLQIPRQLSRVSIPWALMERNDQCLIREGNHLLFHLATRVFVRELLQNRYEIFQAYREGSDRMRIWPKALRGGPRVPFDLFKIRPISLGLRPGMEGPARAGVDKTHDIFWSGKTAFRTPRMAAVDELRESSARHGWRFLCPESLPPGEFAPACARSWLCLSPSGNGWDCYRHYEAAVAGSVPVMNYPWIERYAPLQDGRHGFFYSVERGALTEVVRRALADRDHLLRISREAADWVNRYHTYPALRNYVIQETLAAQAGTDTPSGMAGRAASGPR